MNKILSVAVAAAMVAPLTAQAELKLGGTIQAEIASVKAGNGDRTTVTTDSTGAVANGGPNRLGVDFDEKLNAGLTAFGRVDWAFNTTTGGAAPFSSRESYVGLKGNMAHFKIGRVQGIYKTIETGIDPFYSTGGQARGTGGGMTGGNFGHGSYINNILELGFKGSAGPGKIDFTVQGVADENDRENKSILAGLKYSTDNWGVFLAGAYHDFSFSNATGSLTNDDDNNGNAKIGGWFKTGGLKLGLQYEMAEDGNLQQQTGCTANATRDCTGDYVFGSAAYKMGDVTLAGTVGAYMSDDNNEDALSFSVGAMYNFSKRTFVYAAYHDTNSDNDARDWDAFAAGIRHSF